jgi:HK97 family phage portal protein
LPNLVQRLSAALKAFRVGSAVVEHHEATWGHNTEAFAPAEYGDYLATCSAVYACANLRARNMAGLPLRILRADGSEVETGPAVDLLARVNPFWTANRLIQMTELSLCLWGQACWVLERGASGRQTPSEIWWVRPDRMKPITHPTEYLAGWVYEHNGERLAFSADEVVWFRYPNPLDEFAGLSPIASTRLAIETGTAALRSNRNVFANGTQLAGVVSPADKDTSWTREQVDGLREMLDKRFKGVDKAHRLAVLGQAASFAPMSISPKDAQFVELMRWTRGDVAMVYLTPPELIGDHEHATYSNIDQAYKGFWTDCLVPEASMIAAEITEQLLPMFGQGLVAEFDTSGIASLQEDRAEVTAQAQTWWSMGVPLNRVLQEFAPHLLPEGGKGYAWGDDKGGAAPPAMVPGAQAETPPVPGKAKSYTSKAIALGSPEHRTRAKAFGRRADRHEADTRAAVVAMFKRQGEAVKARLRAGKAIATKAGALWDDDWDDEAAADILPLLARASQDAGDSVMDELRVDVAFDVSRPEVVSFLAERAQRFATQVNGTTWEALKGSLNDGREAGEGIDELAARVDEVMGDRIRSSAETIARTETIGALNGGALLAAQASGVVSGKGWLAALDGRERDTHAAAHEQYQAAPIPLDADFQVGAGAGPAPGQLGAAEEDINCRCSMTWEVEDGEDTRTVRPEVVSAIQAWARRNAP